MPLVTKNKFLIQSAKEIVRHIELWMMVYNKRNQAALETMLAEQFIMSIAARWEAFLSDLFVAYVLVNPNIALENLKEKIFQSLSDRYGTEVAKAMRFTGPKQLTREKAMCLLDPKGWNITAESSSGLSKIANSLLMAKHAKKFSLTAEDATFYDFFITLRNFIVHRSAASKGRLRAAQKNLTGESNKGLKGKLFPIGPYLKFDIDKGNTRAVLIVTKLLEIVKTL